MQKETSFAEANQTKYPEPIVVIVAKDAQGKANPMVAGWAMQVSGSPAMLAVAVAPKRYTAECIRSSGCFTVAFPSEKMKEAVMVFGTKHGTNMDKLKETQTPTDPAGSIDSLLLTEAVTNFECTLESEFVAGDHIVFVGKVAASHVNTDAGKRLYTLTSKGDLGTL